MCVYIIFTIGPLIKEKFIKCEKRIKGQKVKSLSGDIWDKWAQSGRWVILGRMSCPWSLVCAVKWAQGKHLSQGHESDSTTSCHWCWFYQILIISEIVSALFTRFSKGYREMQAGWKQSSSENGLGGRGRRAATSVPSLSCRSSPFPRMRKRWHGEAKSTFDSVVCLFQRHIHVPCNQSDAELHKWLQETGPRSQVYSVTSSCFYFFGF